MWLIFATLFVQFVILTIIDDGPDALLKSIHLVTYAAILTFLIVNRGVPWMWMVAVGALANCVVIVANGGVMPLSQSAQDRAGLPATDRFDNSVVLHHPRLRFLGDVFATPKWLPLASVFSIGDVILFLGLVPMMIAISRVPKDETRSFLRPLEDEPIPEA